jgi:hypothetical protein
MSKKLRELASLKEVTGIWQFGGEAFGIRRSASPPLPASVLVATGVNGH